MTYYGHNMINQKFLDTTLFIKPLLLLSNMLNDPRNYFIIYFLEIYVETTFFFNRYTISGLNRFFIFNQYVIILISN